MKIFNKNKGFTLVEIMVSLAVMTIVGTAAMQIVTGVVHSFKKMDKRAQIDVDSKLLGEYIVSEMQGAGGGQARPWEAIRVSTDANGNDELYIFTTNPDFSGCQIQPPSPPGNGLTGVNAFFTPNSPCCLEDPGNPGTLNPALSSGMEALLICGGTNQGFHVQMHNPNLASCNVDFPSGQQPTGIDVESAIPCTVTDMALGSTKHYYLNNATRVLTLEEDTDYNGTYEQYPLADRVFSFQIALGFDVDNNGQVVDDGSSSDEWLFNNASDTTDTSGSLNGANWPDLRMMQIGLVVGAPISNSNNSVQLLDGPAVQASGWLLRGEIVRSTLRNLLLFY